MHKRQLSFIVILACLLHCKACRCAWTHADIFTFWHGGEPSLSAPSGDGVVGAGTAERFHIQPEKHALSHSRDCYFLSTFICLDPAVGSIYWGRCKRERETMQEGWSRMWQPGASSVSKAERGFTDLLAGEVFLKHQVGHAYHWSSMSVWSGAGVRSRGWVLSEWYGGEKEKVPDSRVK